MNDTTTDTRGIANRIRKLLALAQSPNQHEAENAAAHAQRLMEKHRIDLASLPIEADEPAAPIASGAVFKARAVPTWKALLVTKIAAVNQCRAYKAPGSMIIVGTEQDREIVSLVYVWISKQIDRLAKEYGGGRTAMNQFRLGAVVTVGIRLVEAQREARQGADSTALVRVDQGLVRVNDWMREEGTRIRRASNYARRDDSARAAGMAAGRSVSLRQRAALGAGQ